MRAFLVACGLVVSAYGIGAAVAACGSVSCVDDKNCSVSGDAGGDGTIEGSVIEGGGVDTAPPGCDASKSPKDSAACVADTFGVFVSPAGSDSAAGTKAAPLLTIKAALAKTSASKNRVYVCEGTYAESVTLSEAVNLYGGFDCATWAYGAKAVTVAPSAPGVALTVTSSGVIVEDMEFDAKDGANAGDSSIAVFVSGAQNVLFRRVSAIGGAGQNAASAAPTSNYDGGVAPSGNSATTDLGAPQQDCTGVCANGVHSIGGKGGVGGLSGVISGDGADGGPPLAPNPPGADGIGGKGKLTGCTTGDPGADAVSADGGALGAQTPGKLGAGGWMTSAGVPGQPGGPAQGGGGGSGGTHAAASNNGGGGSGGCGGCGGAGGAAGQSGGSSFALLSYKSGVTLDACTLKSAKGGNGTAGGAGQAGQAGGSRGDAVAAGTGCPGAAGGTGGAGGGGGGGAGGHSVAIGYVDMAPIEQGAVTKQTSTPGTGALGGSGATPAATAGSTGSNAETLPL